MATSIDELKSQLNELDYNFVEHDESTLVLSFKTETYRDPDGDPMVTLVIQLSEEGEHFRIFAPKAFNVEGPKKDVYLRAFMDIQSNTSFLRFGYDDEDGEVRPMIDFAIEDAPPAPGTGHYSITKWLSAEICRIFAQKHDMQIIYFVFNGLGPAPDMPVTEPADTPPFVVVWEDLQQACRLALEVPSVPDNFQLFNMMSYRGPGKYNTNKAHRLLGFEPTRDWDAFYRRQVRSTA
mgnify:CR=1 FL=1